jgi:5'(3')-deoxyribonucleotidase
MTTTRERNYTISSDDDDSHLINGRCPTYALTWSYEDQCRYWNLHKETDYFIGNGKNICDGTEKIRQILSERKQKNIYTKHIIFCDLDGVLADFETGVINKFNKHPDQIKPAVLWSCIKKSKTFYETLPCMPRAKELWNNIRKYHPIILTGVPRGATQQLILQKINWCKRELGDDVQVVTCLTKEKPDYCLLNYILIDDRINNLNEWKTKGGKFILYDENNIENIIEKINIHMNEDVFTEDC